MSTVTEKCLHSTRAVPASLCSPCSEQTGVGRSLGEVTAGTAGLGGRGDAPGHERVVLRRISDSVSELATCLPLN